MDKNKVAKHYELLIEDAELAFNNTVSAEGLLDKVVNDLKQVRSSASVEEMINTELDVGHLLDIAGRRLSRARGALDRVAEVQVVLDRIRQAMQRQADDEQG